VLSDGLRVLARLTGVATLDAFFGAMLEQVMIPAEMERIRLRRHVMLGRYGKQPVSQWHDMDGRLVRQYAQALADILQEEADAQRKAMESAGK